MSIIVNFIKSILNSMLQLFSFGKRRLSNSVSVYIKSNIGSTLSVDLDPKWDIKNVKEIVAPQLGLQPEEVKIIFAGKELCDSTIIEECDLGQQSILHAVKAKPSRNKLRSNLNSSETLTESLDESSGSTSKTLNESLLDLQQSPREGNEVTTSVERKKTKAHFYVYCSTCKGMKPGKIRVRCKHCKSGAFTVNADPENWDDVLQPKRITGVCENISDHVLQTQASSSSDDQTWAEFYFKCSEHPSEGEFDQSVPLYLIKANLYDVPCIACTDTSDPVLVFPCEQAHVVCIECFKQYCGSRLRDRQFWPHEEFGYTLDCPAGCENSYIAETHHFRLLTEVQYMQYQRFAAEEYVLRQGGVLCPQPGCGMGILPDDNCERITCRSCGYSWPRNDNLGAVGGGLSQGSLWPGVQSSNAARGRWTQNQPFDPASLATTKPCPKCGVKTERDGGCMHMVCARGACKFHWCWVCHSAWTRDCMGSHWFG